ncbi:hypothetical protein BCR37DRAFT_387458 [Protomyces lactucae-debilis]|uniref:Uncharacterized protein n=1 Tax=Protomyces lactucae-debilis TaxID=2754530 RepID=A0A1Y2FDG6_PROLT|nr:uncharacterized protein BCR37DRAFT_387458 [Protomyces lactucae-debilis]ORY81968.1 hypothetical protein BCR37DRAFT_387458 [Protomyces lactucae-debilis]
MASVMHSRQKGSASSRFSWLSKLYKRTATHGDPTAARNNNAQNAHHLSTPASSVHGAPFLSLQQTGSSLEGSGSDASSLRPTISTRAPSVSSNAAVLNVEAPSQARGLRDSRMPSMLSLTDTSDRRPVDPEDRPLATEKTEDDLSEADGETVDTPRIGMDEETADNASTHSPMASLHSSKESTVLSIFTTRTAETQPTFFPQTAASLLSQRTSGVMGTGAADNASMLTLASSSKARRRRRSIDTQASMRALAPASARTSFESAHTQHNASTPATYMPAGDTSAMGGRTGTSLAGSLYNYRSMLHNNMEDTRDADRLSTGQRSVSGYSLQSLDAHLAQGSGSVQPALMTQPAIIMDVDDEQVV